MKLDRTVLPVQAVVGEVVDSLRDLVQPTQDPAWQVAGEKVVAADG